MMREYALRCFDQPCDDCEVAKYIADRPRLSAKDRQKIEVIAGVALTRHTVFGYAPQEVIEDQVAENFGLDYWAITAAVRSGFRDQCKEEIGRINGEDI